MFLGVYFAPPGADVHTTGIFRKQYTCLSSTLCQHTTLHIAQTTGPYGAHMPGKVSLLQCYLAHSVAGHGRLTKDWSPIMLSFPCKICLRQF